MLKEALKDASLFGSSVVLNAKSGKLFIEARGSTGQFKSVLSDLERNRPKSPAEVISKYSLSFLSNIIRETNPEQAIDLFLKTDSPMKVEYSLGEASFKFHLAHMIL
jgi:proliferating cell nuclear antigen